MSESNKQETNVTEDLTPPVDDNADKQEKANEQQDDTTAPEETMSTDDSESTDEMAALDAEQLLEKLNKAQTKADKNWDLALRSKAEMDNIRRRTEKDIANARKFGIEKLANELLPVKDSLELGLKSAKETSSEDPIIVKIIEGMQMTLQQLETAMDKVSIEDVTPEEGDTFDPALHQAMSMLEMEGRKKNTIVSVFQKGYSLNERLLRPAMVVVAK